MKWIKNILREIYGLFVDDGAFALAVLIWVGVVLWTTSHFAFSSAIAAIILFAGLALILIESTTRYARRRQRLKK